MDSTAWDTLRDAAFDVRQKAYAPYSGFRVGAALLAADGRVFVGCNVENASHGAAICAERGALSAAVAAGCTKLVGLAIATAANTPTPPCGICRQALSEFAPELAVRSYIESGGYAAYTLSELLPQAFGPSQLT